MDTFVNQMVMVDKMDIFVNQMGMVDKMDIFVNQMGMVDEMGTFINHLVLRWDLRLRHLRRRVPFKVSLVFLLLRVLLPWMVPIGGFRVRGGAVAPPDSQASVARRTFLKFRTIFMCRGLQKLDRANVSQELIVHQDLPQRELHIQRNNI
jgi:hypothetical protein